MVQGRFKKGNIPWNKGARGGTIKQRVPRFFCPYKCGHIEVGNVGWRHRMKLHYEKDHPDKKFGDFDKLVPSHFRINLKPKGEMIVAEDKKVDEKKVEKTKLERLVSEAEENFPPTTTETTKQQPL